MKNRHFVCSTFVRKKSRDKTNDNCSGASKINATNVHDLIKLTRIFRCGEKIGFEKSKQNFQIKITIQIKRIELPCNF